MWVYHQASFMKDLDCRTVFGDSYRHNSPKAKNMADPTFPLQILTPHRK